MLTIARLGRPTLRYQVSAVAMRVALSSSTESNPLTAPTDFKTHTGQAFEEGDYRLVKFEGKKKEVNTRFAIDLIAEVPPIAVKGRTALCDGGDGPLGHPRVFINLDQPGNHTCGYCGLRFFQDGSHDSN